MRYCALACDYDGTLALNGVVNQATLEALQRWKMAGGALLLVTGRELADLQRIFPCLDCFNRLVAENGAVLVNPSTGGLRNLVEPVPAAFVDRLRKAAVHPLSVGRVIVATREPYEVLALELIRELGLELQVIFNKGAVMILPTGVNKATGLKAALKELNLSPQQVAGIGDAENDHAFLEVCGLSVAVANALPALKERADLVTQADHGEGVSELIDQLLKAPITACAR